jgi:hypothetical protein
MQQTKRDAACERSGHVTTLCVFISALVNMSAVAKPAKAAAAVPVAEDTVSGAASGARGRRLGPFGSRNMAQWLPNCSHFAFWRLP